MRILSMIASLAESGGAEMLVRNLSLGFADRGHACHIVYISDAAALGASPAFERDFMARLDAAGIGYTRLGHDTRRKPWLGAWRLRRAVKAFAPDVAHLHLGYALLFQAIGLIRVPTVYTHHNIVFKFSTRLFRVFDRFVDRYVAICAACETLLARHVQRPIELIYNGVPESFARGTPRTRLPDDIAVLSVGNLTPQKDYAGLIEAAAQAIPAFAAQGRSLTFSIAGEGAERAALEAAIADRGLGGQVRLLGVRRDIADLMADADLLVLGSRFEGLPISLIEAATSALPVVATDVGGVDEIVEDGVTGVLVPAAAPARLASAIGRVLSRESRYRAMSLAARTGAERFAMTACIDAHLALYARVAQR